jgi:hypothetical protein
MYTEIPPPANPRAPHIVAPSLKAQNNDGLGNHGALTGAKP